MNQATETIVTIATAIVGVAIIAVLVSQRSNTANVIQAMGSAFTNALGVAVSPVNGSPVQVNTSYPNQGFGNVGALLQMPVLGGFPH